MADPKLVQMIVKAAKATGADPKALLATALQESGARFGAVGDQGTSFGPFQFHKGGALGSHNAAWANSYDAILNRAGEFARLGVHGGKGAAAVQRPADQASYAVGVQAKLKQASELLGMKISQDGQHTQPPTPSEVAATAPQTAAPAISAQNGTAGPSRALAMLGGLADSTNALLGGEGHTGLGALIGSLPAASVPAAPPLPSEAASVKPTETPGKVPNPAVGVPGRVDELKNAKIIGTPHHGTHNLGNWESDNAVDIAMPTGTPIYAPADGTIGSQFGALTTSKDSRFAGLRAHLVTGKDELYYAHLSKFAPGIKPGAKVKAGQIIGYSGSANGVQHLHLGSKAGHPQAYE